MNIAPSKARWSETALERCAAPQREKKRSADRRVRMVAVRHVAADRVHARLDELGQHLPREPLALRRGFHAVSARKFKDRELEVSASNPGAVAHVHLKMPLRRLQARESDPFLQIEISETCKGKTDRRRDGAGLRGLALLRRAPRPRLSKSRLPRFQDRGPPRARGLRDAPRLAVGPRPRSAVALCPTLSADPACCSDGL